MNAWEVILLSAFHALGGSADLQRIYIYLERHAPLRPHHRRTTEWGGRPAYQHQVRSHVVNLCQTGDLRRVARGHYAITTKGRARLGNTAATLALR